MRRQNVRLTDHAGDHRRWISLEEAERLLNDGQARRVSRRKAPQAVFALIWSPGPSTSARSTAALTHSDMKILTNLPKDFIEGLSAEKVEEMPQGRVRSLQRLMGWNLLPYNKALADAGDTPG